MSNQEQNVLSGSFNLKKCILFAVAVLITLLLWNLPLDYYGINGLTVIQRRVIAIFAFATILWITEAIPSWATSVSVIGIMLFTISDNAFKFMRDGFENSSIMKILWLHLPTQSLFFS